MIKHLYLQLSWRLVSCLSNYPYPSTYSIPKIGFFLSPFIFRLSIHLCSSLHPSPSNCLYSSLFTRSPETHTHRSFQFSLLHLFINTFPIRYTYGYTIGIGRGSPYTPIYYPSIPFGYPYTHPFEMLMLPENQFFGGGRRWKGGCEDSQRGV